MMLPRLHLIAALMGIRQIQEIASPTIENYFLLNVAKKNPVPILILRVYKSPVNHVSKFKGGSLILTDGGGRKLMCRITSLAGSCTDPSLKLVGLPVSPHC